VTFLTTDEFEFTFQLDDANGDLSSARLVARLGATELLLWSQILSGFTSAASTTFKIQSEGDWQVVAVVSDRSGRVIEYPLTAVGGGSEVLLMIRNSGSTSVATPTLRTFPRNSCQLVCTTSGATIKYQIVALYAAPGGSWTTYTGAFTVTAGKTVYAYALKAGMTDSAVVSWNFP
jgi:hypothetical protein